jgi:hypothetical protein
MYVLPIVVCDFLDIRQPLSNKMKYLETTQLLNAYFYLQNGLLNLSASHFGVFFVFCHFRYNEISRAVHICLASLLTFHQKMFPLLGANWTQIALVL